jgi:murein DD-endopeptidase MepM/ murein hydrolase activator NlpD
MRSCFKGKFRVTSPFGKRTLNGSTSQHYGIDLVGEDDTTVYAPCDGVIGASTIVFDKSNRTWEWGNYIRLDTHDKKHSIYLCHLASRSVTAGKTVKKGDRLGVMGNTGYSFGAHTHYEVRKYGTAVKENPADFIGIPNRVGTYAEDDEVQEIAEYVSVLNKAGIIDNIELWKRKAASDKDIYWLLRKTATKLKEV